MRARQARAETRRYGRGRRADRECQRTKYAGSGGTLPTRLLAAGGRARLGGAGAGAAGSTAAARADSGQRVRARSTEREEGEGRRNGARLELAGTGGCATSTACVVCVTASSVWRPVSSVHHGRVQVSVGTGSGRVSGHRRAKLCVPGRANVRPKRCRRCFSADGCATGGRGGGCGRVRMCRFGPRSLGGRRAEAEAREVGQHPGTTHTGSMAQGVQWCKQTDKCCSVCAVCCVC